MAWTGMIASSASQKRKDQDGMNAEDMLNGGRQEKKMRGQSGEAEGLPDVGDGPRWRLPAGKEMETSGTCDNEARRRCQMLLEQALSCSRHADVQFEFDDGEPSRIFGHWGMLCGICKVFEVMHSCGMVEAQTRKVRVVGMSIESFRAFLEWLYLGRAGKEMAGADGREVWLLAERYQIDGVKEWLMGEGLETYGVCAAAHYALEGDGEGRTEILQACKKKAQSMTDIAVLDEDLLYGVRACALVEVLEGHHVGGDFGLHGERAMERFRVVERWVRANELHGECDDDDLSGLIGAVELGVLPLEFLEKVVRPSGLADKWLVDRIVGNNDHDHDVCVGHVKMHHMKSFGSKGDVGQVFRDICHIAVHEDSEGERLAVVNNLDSCVVVFDVASGEHLMSIGTKGTDPGQFQLPWGVAFTKQGGLIVTDWNLHRVQVFDRHGVHVRTFGSEGRAMGKFRCPSGVAVNGQGQIIVCDSENHRMQIFRADGKYVRKFGCEGGGPGEFKDPMAVAVGPDERIVVLDCLNQRVQVFDCFGVHVMTIGCEGVGVAELVSPFALCVGKCGEIIVCDQQREDVLVFNDAGLYMQSIGRGRDSDCDLKPGAGVAVDGQGRLFVCNLVHDDGDTDRRRMCVDMLGMKLA